MCRMRRFLAVLRSLFHSSLLCTFSCQSSQSSILLSSLISSFQLFLGLPVYLFVPKLSLLWILFSSTLCTCPKQRSLFNSIVSIIEGFLTLDKFLYWLTSCNFLFHCHILGLKFFYTLSFQKCSIDFYLPLVSVPVSDAHVNVLSIYLSN